MSHRGLAHLALAVLGTLLIPPQPAATASEVLPLTSNARGWHALLIARSRDCGSRLDFASVFEWPHRTAVQFEGLAITDGVNDAEVTRHTIAGPRLRRLPYSPMHSTLLTRLALPSPVLVIYDVSRKVRFAIGAPRTVAAADRLALWLVR